MRINQRKVARDTHFAAVEADVANRRRKVDITVGVVDRRTVLPLAPLYRVKLRLRIGFGAPPRIASRDNNSRD